MKIEKLILNEERNVTLTAYIPDVSVEMPNMSVKPGILVLPGGGYHMCSDREAEPVAFEFMAKGYNVFILRYSLKEHSIFPNPLDDAILALRTIIDKSEEWCTYADRIAVCGFSAGGHLAAALCTMSELKPKACILGYPCTLEKISKILSNPIPGLDSLVSETTPPTFIVAASDDDVVPIENSIIYADMLAKHNVPYEMHIFSRGGHGFSTSTDVVTMPERREFVKNTKVWIDLCLAWLDQTL